MAINVTGLLTSLGINVTGLEAQATNYLMQQAANWARLPTRLARVEAARAIVAAAAAQKGNAGVAAKMAAAQEAIRQTQTLYDSTSGQVADVVDQVRTLPAGKAPPLALAPKVAQVAATVTAITKTVTGIEGQVSSAAASVLTPAQLAQLKAGGLSFPSFMGVHLKQVLVYLAIGVPLYLTFLRPRPRRRHF